ncbi:S49 family peptidase [Pseudomonas sp. F1_0610]|uniref:S49 family peptidase n=1 Tax=Pseudomonas sp. F1_0610 TaxID=3114284 RepID=UPI0039C1B2BF
MSALLTIASQPWLIQPDALDNILTIANRENDVHALETRLGHKLENTRKVTISDGVAVIPVTGPIFRYANLFTEISGATSTQVLATDIQTALDDPKVKAIVLNVDSPGGQASGINELADLVYQGRNKKRIVAYVGGMGASAAYWIASAAHEVVVDAIGVVGSIGAVLTVTTQQEKEGQKTWEIVSHNAPNKRPDLKTEEGRAKVGEMIDALGTVFQTQVAMHLGVAPEKVTQMGDSGGVLVGQLAVTAGLAHRLGSLEQIKSELAASASNPNRGNPLMTVVKTTAELQAAVAAGEDPKNITIAESVAATAELDKAKAEAVTAERERISGIQAMAVEGFDAEIKAAIDGGLTVEAAALSLVKASQERGISLAGIKADSTQVDTETPTTEADKKQTEKQGVLAAMLKGAGLKK